MSYPDISHYHPVTDWATVKKNCPFLISKATQGTENIDPTLTSVIKGCEQNKISYWLYCYLNKGNELAQAKFMVNTCKNKIGSYFMGYVLDVEAGNSASNVKAAMDYLAGLGGKSMLYTMYADYDQYASIIKARPSTCAWWEARYGEDNGSYNPKYPCHSGADLHQYTDQGSCAGISGKVDLSRLTGTKAESWFTTAATTTEEEETEVVQNVKMKINGSEQTVKSIQKDGRNYVQLAQMGELLGLKVDYKDSTPTIDFAQLKIKIKDTDHTVSGGAMVPGTSFAGVRELLELLGYTVGWDAGTATVTVTSPKA